MGGFYPFASSSSSGLLLPSGDLTGVKDTAAINALVQAGGAALLKDNSTYYVANLLVDSYGVIAGQGPGSVLQAVAGTTGSMIALKTPATTQQVLVRDVTLIPNTGTLNGIFLDNTGFSPAIFDSRHQLRNVYIFNAGGDSFSFGTNIRGAVIDGCVQYWGTGYGFTFATSATDNFLTSCVSGHSGNHGYNLAGGNNMLAACKAFFAGFNQNLGTWGTTQAGFALPSTSTYNTLVGCSAQQSALHGFDLQSSLHCTLAGCVADTNGAGTGVTTGVGVNLNGATYCTVTGMSGQNNGGLSPGNQVFGMQVNGTLTGCDLFANTVRGNSGGLNNLGGSGYTRVDGLSADFSSSQFLKFSSWVLAADGVQTIATSGTIKTATDGLFAGIPVTTAAAVTGVILEPPSNTWAQVTVINESANSITFAVSGTSHVADGVSNVIPALTARTFTYDGNTNLWYRTA